MRSIRIQVKIKEDFNRLNQWIEACCILHNLTMQCNDEWEENEPEGGMPEGIVGVNDPLSGVQLRERIQRFVLSQR